MIGVGEGKVRSRVTPELLVLVKMSRLVDAAVGIGVKETAGVGPPSPPAGGFGEVKVVVGEIFETSPTPFPDSSFLAKGLKPQTVREKRNKESSIPPRTEILNQL